jgi:hypothetical protein
VWQAAKCLDVAAAVLAGCKHELKFLACIDQPSEVWEISIASQLLVKSQSSSILVAGDCRQVCNPVSSMQLVLLLLQQDDSSARECLERMGTSLPKALEASLGFVNSHSLLCLDREDRCYAVDSLESLDPRDGSSLSPIPYPRPDDKSIAGNAVGEPKRESILERAEVVGKALGGLTVLSYVMGLLIVNAYLFSLGVADFDVLRPRYIYTGGLVVLGIVLATGGFLFARSFFRPPLSLIRGWDLHSPEPALAVSASIAYFIALVSASKIHGDVGISEILASVPNALTLYVYALGTGLFLVGGIHFWRQVSNRRSSIEFWRIPWWTRVFSLLALSIVSLGLLLFSFAGTVYGGLPVPFGGGRPTPVQIVVDEEGTRALMALRVPSDVTNGTVRCALQVLYEGNDYYLFGCGTLSFKLEKDHVLVVRVR